VKGDSGERIKKTSPEYVKDSDGTEEESSNEVSLEEQKSMRDVRSALQMVCLTHIYDGLLVDTVGRL
jgi:hypothetical protein